MPVLRTRGYGTRQRAADATMRVSDAERAEVADQLAQHYGDGRLDQAELDERLGRAMSAKTRADLAGITDDLPEVTRAEQPPGAPAPLPAAPRARRPAGRGLLPIVLLIAVGCRHLARRWRVLALVVVRLRAGFGPAWLWIALLVFCWLRFGPRRHRR